MFNRHMGLGATTLNRTDIEYHHLEKALEESKHQLFFLSTKQDLKKARKIYGGQYLYNVVHGQCLPKHEAKH